MWICFYIGTETLSYRKGKDMQNVIVPALTKESSGILYMKF